VCQVLVGAQALWSPKAPAKVLSFPLSLPFSLSLPFPKVTHAVCVGVLISHP
jgi:hypothetical protein